MLNYCGIIEESVIALTLNALNGLIYGLTNMDLCVCDFAVCDI